MGVILYRHKETGFAIIEGLVAAAIVATVAAGSSTLVNYIYKQSRRAQVLNRAVSTQSALVNALLNKTQWDTSKGGTRAALINSISPSVKPVGLQILDDPTSSAPKVLGVIGQRVGYNWDATDASSESSCLNGKCPIYVDVDLQCGDLTSNGCKIAYRVSIENQPDVLPTPLGAARSTTGDPKGFKAADYNLVLSYDYFTQKVTSDCSSDPDNILITGMNRVTGQVNCVPKQVTACSDPQVAHGVAVQNGRLNLQCHPLSRVQCPTDYVLQEMEFSQLDQGPLGEDKPIGGLRGVCVYRWKNNIDWQRAPFRTASTGTTASVSGNPCNTQIYDAYPNGSCNAIFDSNPGVYCPATCYNYDPVIPGKIIGSYDCSYWIYASATTVSDPPGLNKPIASCTVNVTQQSCSGGTTSGVAHGDWTGKCIVQESRAGRNPALKYPPVGGVMGP